MAILTSDLVSDRLKALPLASALLLNRECLVH